jgi:metallopeptidase MepB
MINHQAVYPPPTMASSDFKVPPQPPPNFNDTPAGLLADTQTLINNTRQLHDQIVASINPSEAAFSSVLLPLIEDHNLAASRRRIFKFYGSTSTSSELRDASHASEILFTEFETETLQREDLFQLVDAIFHRDENLDPESQVYLERQHRAFARNGLKIGAGPQRERFAEIKKELLEKSIAYRKSLNRRAGIWLTATELDGLPDNKMASLTVGEGENAGRLWLPLQKSDADNVWQYVKNGDVRRKIYVSRDNRCLDNVPRLKEIIVLRDESARLLGYRNHAEFSIEEKIAESTSFVNQFIRDLRENLTPRAKDKLGQLLELKRATVKDNSNANDLDPSEFNTLYAWDFGFYNNLTKDKWHSFDENRFSEYFSLERSLTGIMGIFSRIFGLQFFQITRDNYQKFGSEHVMTWHEDVYVYSVWNDDSEGGEFVGYLYLDLFPRDDKFNHAGHYGLQFVRAFCNTMLLLHHLTQTRDIVSSQESVCALLQPWS